MSVFGRLFRASAIVATLGFFAAPSRAYAQSPPASPPLVVVDVAPAEPALDAAALRSAIARELGAEVAAALVYGTEQPSGSRDLGPFVGFTAVGVADTAMGIYMLTTDGPVESALHEYERTIGRTVRPGDTTAMVQPLVAPLPGGGVVGLGGRF